MSERESAFRGWHLFDESRAHSFVESIHQLILGQLLQCDEQRDIEFPTDPGGKAQRPRTIRAGPRDPSSDHFLDALRDAELRDCRPCRRHLLETSYLSVFLKVPHEFADEKRVPAGVLAYELYDLG